MFSWSLWRSSVSVQIAEIYHHWMPICWEDWLRPCLNLRYPWLGRSAPSKVNGQHVFEAGCMSCCAATNTRQDWPFQRRLLNTESHDSIIGRWLNDGMTWTFDALVVLIRFDLKGWSSYQRLHPFSKPWGKPWGGSVLCIIVGMVYGHWPPPLSGHMPIHYIIYNMRWVDVICMFDDTWYD